MAKKCYQKSPYIGLSEATTLKKKLLAWCYLLELKVSRICETSCKFSKQTTLNGHENYAKWTPKFLRHNGAKKLRETNPVSVVVRQQLATKSYLQGVIWVLELKVSRIRKTSCKFVRQSPLNGHETYAKWRKKFFRSQWCKHVIKNHLILALVRRQISKKKLLAECYLRAGIQDFTNLRNISQIC